MTASAQGLQHSDRDPRDGPAETWQEAARQAAMVARDRYAEDVTRAADERRRAEDRRIEDRSEEDLNHEREGRERETMRTDLLAIREDIRRRGALPTHASAIEDICRQRRLQSDIEAIRQDIRRREERLAESREELQDMESRRSAIRREIEDLESRRAAVRDQIREISSRREVVREEIQERRRQLAEDGAGAEDSRNTTQ